MQLPNTHARGQSGNFQVYQALLCKRDEELYFSAIAKSHGHSVRQRRSPNFTLRATEAERRRRKNRGAQGAEGWELGVWESVVSSPSGIRGGALAANAFLAYLRPKEHFW